MGYRFYCFRFDIYYFSLEIILFVFYVYAEHFIQFPYYIGDI